MMRLGRVPCLPLECRVHHTTSTPQVGGDNKGGWGVSSKGKIREKYSGIAGGGGKVKLSCLIVGSSRHDMGSMEHQRRREDEAFIGEHFTQDKEGRTWSTLDPSRCGRKKKGEMIVIPKVHI